ncbi:hypothetical protein BJY24_004652 [Nocardia transvalensis]|uniref:Uncharacterized protein n=1 Tax=Nocardia transvalensis TaxID=37333 RepID=A0A7W9PGP5_9NOCA|nr:hypothetical protein [Nocardia transvalensis]MBB5915740.1 hypothetical protein [Nocardia transvalensis]
MTMPAPVGAKVLAAVPMPIPVLGDPRESRWTFLVRPNCPVPSCLAEVLADREVTVADRGRVVMLPRSDRGWGARWVSQPDGVVNALPGLARILREAYTNSLPVPEPTGG